MCVVALARRRGGSLLMFATALAVVVMCRSLPTEVLSTPFNPGAALLPFTLLIFLCWSLACGEYRLLPITVVVASFVVQCHLTYATADVGNAGGRRSGTGVALAARPGGAARRPASPVAACLAPRRACVLERPAARPGGPSPGQLGGTGEDGEGPSADGRAGERLAGGSARGRGPGLVAATREAAFRALPRHRRRIPAR